MTTTAVRRALVAVTAAAALLPTAPALAQTAAPTPSAGLTGFTVSRSLIDIGETVDVTVSGSAGTPVRLFLGNFRAPEGRQIRAGTIGSGGSLTWTGLRPEDSVLLFARGAGSDTGLAGETVRVRRTVTIGVQQRVRGTYVFSGQVARAEAGVPVTVARLDSRTGRATGVVSTRTTADGRYSVSTGLPNGLGSFYAIADAANGLDAGRSRLYGLLVNTAPAPVQAVSLDVGRSTGTTYVFSGAVTPGRSVPVTLARVVDGRLVPVAGGRSAADGGYVFRVPVAPGTSAYQVVTATARSRVYGLVVPAVQSDPRERDDLAASAER